MFPNSLKYFINNWVAIRGYDLRAHVRVRPQLFSPAAKHLVLDKNRTPPNTTRLLIAKHFPKYLTSQSNIKQQSKTNHFKHQPQPSPSEISNFIKDSVPFIQEPKDPVPGCTH